MTKSRPQDKKALPSGRRPSRRPLNAAAQVDIIALTLLVYDEHCRSNLNIMICMANVMGTVAKALDTVDVYVSAHIALFEASLSGSFRS